MISNRRQYAWILLTAFLLVIAHDLTPHSHSFWGHMPTISSEQPHVAEGGILETLIELDLGVDHLEHFTPASDLPISTSKKQVVEQPWSTQPLLELALAGFSVVCPYPDEPALHPVFLSPHCLFRGPPVVEA